MDQDDPDSNLSQLVNAYEKRFSLNGAENGQSIVRTVNCDDQLTNIKISYQAVNSQNETGKPLRKQVNGMPEGGGLHEEDDDSPRSHGATGEAGALMMLNRNHL
jgi:hypothetical protein